jgi:hypothetical protein
MISDIAEILDEWKTEVMPRVRVGIKELRADYPDFERERRTEYLKGRMEQMIFKTFYLMNDYEELQKGNDVDSRLFVGGQIIGAIKTIRKLQGEIIALRAPGKKNGKGRMITDEMIERAREYPYDQLITLNRNRMAPCPFHGDKAPSFSVKNNRGTCFGCHWKGDTIAFVMEKDGVTFADAVRRLQR